MEFEFFIGIDVSKNELDFSVQQGKSFLYHREIDNDPVAINAFVKELASVKGFSFSKAIFCMEHTGIYCNHLLTYLHKKKANICLEAAVHIKKSLGTIRGKNDKVDSARICQYAYEKRDSLRLWIPKREVVQQLANLTAVRLRLINAKKSLKTAVTEYVSFGIEKVVRENVKLCSHALKAIDTDLHRTEKAIQEVIASDEELSRIYALITSVTSGTSRMLGIMRTQFGIRRDIMTRG